MIDERSIFLAKAEESLAGAESEFSNGRYNNCANRCYYACFQAAIVALLDDGIRPGGGRAEWGHAFVQSQFVGQLINRRKRYSSRLREVLAQALILRERADYRLAYVGEVQANRNLDRVRAFLAAVKAGGQRP